MKKILALLVVMAMSVTMFIGCGSSDKDTNKGQNTENDSNANQSTEKDDANSEKDEIDTSVYSEKIELTTANGKTVQVYYNPSVVNGWVEEDGFGGTDISVGEMIAVAVIDAESAMDVYASDIASGSVEIGKHEEILLADYTVHYLTLNEKESGAFLDKRWAIELDSDVVFVFYTLGSVEEGTQLEKELEAIKFVVK